MDALIARAKKIDLAGGELHLYQSSFSLPTGSASPFLVSPEPLVLPQKTIQEIVDFGRSLAKYYAYLQRERGDQPDFFFLRPDIILTDDGWQVCEVETSIFGFALSLFLSSHYESDFLVVGSAEKGLSVFIDKWLQRWGEDTGNFVYSGHTKKFVGQLQYLSELLKRKSIDFSVLSVENPESIPLPAYRCFYTFESQLDPAVRNFMRENKRRLPRFGNFYEGKEPLVYLWKEGEIPGGSGLTIDDWHLLRRHMVPTWKLTEVVPRGFSLPIREWSEIARLPKSERRFVVKRVGAHPDASWAKSVHFLDEMSHDAALRLLLKLAKEKSAWWVIQPIIEGAKFTQTYVNFAANSVESLSGRVRLTPYFDFQTGELLCAKATIRAHTRYIHGATDSINTVVAL